ncbi:MAG: hypothetical protein ACE5MK_05900 [Acidobacteriota bacterium]
MSSSAGIDKRSFLFQISEDWWAVIVGLALIALVYLGVLGKVAW